jgi:hypothetical protein
MYFSMFAHNARDLKTFSDSPPSSPMDLHDDDELSSTNPYFPSSRDCTPDIFGLSLSGHSAAHSFQRNDATYQPSRPSHETRFSTNPSPSLSVGPRHDFNSYILIEASPSYRLKHKRLLAT